MFQCHLLAWPNFGQSIEQCVQSTLAIAVCPTKLDKGQQTNSVKLTDDISLLVWFSQTILVGDSGVGKTSLLVQFDTGTFHPSSFAATVGIGFTVSATLWPISCVVNVCSCPAFHWTISSPFLRAPRPFYSGFRPNEQSRDEQFLFCCLFALFSCSQVKLSA